MSGLGPHSTSRSHSRVVIVDEAHRMKEPRAKSTLALKKIRCSSCFALTGTLVQNRIDEMWAVLDFVSIPSSDMIVPTETAGLAWLGGHA